MKNFFYLLTLLLIVIACAYQLPEKQEIRYVNNAVKEAKASDKLLIIEFWAPECGPCIRLKHDIFENVNNREFLNKNFVIVKVSPSDSVYRSLWKYYNLEYQSTVIFLDMNGNEIDRTVSYDGNRDAYLNFMREVSEGINLYSVVFSTYKKDTLNVNSNYVLAKKLLFRYQIKEAINHFNRVLLYDQDNRFGHNPESRFRIAEGEEMLNGDLSKMKEYTKRYFNKEYVPKAYEYLISDLINRKDQNSCIPLCEEAYDKYPDSYEILNKYAWAICTFRLREKYGKALKMVQNSITINPERAGTYSTEAWIHFEMGDRQEAIQFQKKAIELYPNPSYIRDLEVFQQ